MDRKCKNHNRFCCICRHVAFPDHQAKITDFVKKAHQAYLAVELADQDKPFTRHICCKICVENLRDWKNKKRKYMSFGFSMMWWEGEDQVSNCYFCMANLKGINSMSKHHVQ